MNDDELINRLGEVGIGGPRAARGAQEQLRVARCASARRRALGAGGSALSLAAIVALVVTLSPTSGGADTVIAADGGPDEATAQGASSDGRAPSTSPNAFKQASARNAALLAKVMGRDFTYADGAAEGTLRPGTPSAEGLPEGYEANVSMTAGIATHRALPQYCRSMVEKGFVQDGCVDRELADGTVVRDNWGRWGSTERYPQQTTGETVRVLFQQDKVLAWVDLGVSGPSKGATEADLEAARKWIESFGEKLGTLVTSPDVQPDGIIRADGDPEPKTVEAKPAETDGRSVRKAENLCPDGVKQTVMLDFAWAGKGPQDEDEALRMLVAGRRGWESGNLEKFRVERKEYSTWAWTRSEDGKVTDVVEVTEGKRSYIAGPFFQCN